MLRRPIAAIAVVALVAVGSVGPANAQDSEETTYGAGASAVALELSLAGQGLSFSNTGAVITSDPEAAANGAAVLLVGDEPVVASTPGGPATAEDCIVDEELPAPIDLLGVELACVHMTTNADPGASSLSDELVLDVISAEAVGQVSDMLLRPILEQALAGLQPLLDGLDPILAVPTLDEVIDQLLADLEDGDSLALISVAPTGSVASAADASGASQGVRVELLPGLGSPITVIVGDSSATASADLDTGEVTVAGEAAFVSIELGSIGDVLVDTVSNLTGALGAPIADALGPLLTTLIETVEGTLPDALNVTVDQLACSDSNPLAAVICFTAGGVNELDAAAAAALGFDFGSTTRGVQAEVLDLAVLSALGEDPLLGLRIGGAVAAAAAVPGTPIVTPPLVPDGPRDLPKTGGDAALPLTLALLAVGAAGAVLIRRTRPV